MKKRIIGSLFLANVLLFTNISNDVFATDETNSSHKGTISLSEGDFTLTVSEANNFGSHTILKKKTTISTDFKNPITVKDARGTQAGWEIIVSATPFTIQEPDDGWVKENPYSLPMGSFTLDTIESVEGLYKESAAIYPTIYEINQAIDLGQSIKVVTAGKGKGMGEYELAFSDEALNLVIDPTTAKIDKVNYPNSVTPYESTITWDLVSGPGVVSTN